jgi:putative membrane protein
MKTIFDSIKEYKATLIFTLSYLIPFTVYFITNGDGEFIFYVAVVVILFLAVIGTLPFSKFTRGIVWVLSVWGILHLAGGRIKIGDTVLYDLQLIPLYKGTGEMILIKYDQVVHAFGFGICAYIIFYFLKRYSTNPYRLGMYAIAALGAIGIGALNEIVEFISVIIFPDNGVGGYVNNALDLIFNTLDALIVMTVIWFQNRKKQDKIITPKPNLLEQ